MQKLKILLGTGIYSGFFPKAPGTFGSLISLFFLYPVLQAQNPLLTIFSVVCYGLISLWVSPYFESEYGEDPGNLVMDEWAGQSLVFIPISITGALEEDLLVLLCGFILFRFFDILKPLGLKKIQDLKGRIGILADDLLAGLYALISLKTLIFLWPKIFGMVQ